tara:strand:- start:513 stop:1061 length:549 start_codon:yes stop_codon:yes gene_type:complete
MGTIKTTNIEPIADNGTVTLGSSGDQFTLATGAKTSFLYPAFHAYVSSDQTLSNNTTTVVAFDTETFDTDNCYNTSTHKFTPNVAGKYSFSFCVNLKNTNGVYYMQADLRKNGSNISSARGPVFENASSGDQSLETVPLVQTIIMDMNGSSDYITVTAYFYNNGSGVIDGERSFINGFRLGT